MTLELAYWLALGVGLGLLLISVFLGDVLDFLSFLDTDIGGDFAAVPIFLTATSAFGAGGLLGLNAFEASRGMSVLFGLGFAVVLGPLAGFLFAALRRQEAEDAYSTDKLVGARGRCTLAVPPGGQGRVSVQFAGMTRSYSATSDATVAVGEEIVVVDVIGSTLRVTGAKADRSAQVQPTEGGAP